MFAQLLLLAFSKKPLNHIPTKQRKIDSNSFLTQEYALVIEDKALVHEKPNPNSRRVATFDFLELIPFDEYIENEFGLWISFIDQMNNRRYVLAEDMDGNLHLYY